MDMERTFGTHPTDEIFAIEGAYLSAREIYGLWIGSGIRVHRYALCVEDYAGLQGEQAETSLGHAQPMVRGMTFGR